MSVTTTVLFGLGLLSRGILLGGLLVRIRSQSGRFWPHGTRWTFWLGWTAWTVALVILFGVSMFASWTRSR